MIDQERILKSAGELWVWGLGYENPLPRLLTPVLMKYGSAQNVATTAVLR